MKRYFYLAIKVINKHLGMNEFHFVTMVFPKSDVQRHLADKLFTYRNAYSNTYNAVSLLSFYESLDNKHQLWFDQWFNSEMSKIDATTIQHTAGALANGDDPKVQRLKGVLLTVKDELVFGGDWATARRVIDEVMKEL